MPRKATALLLLALLAGCAASGGGNTSRSGEPSAQQRAAETNLKLGQAYMQSGELEHALDKLQKAIQLDPRSAQAHTVLAILLERIGRNDKAGDHYERSVQLTPTEGNVLNNYGAYLCRHRRHAEADAMFARALDDPFYRTPGAALANAGVCAAEAGDAQQAERYFRRALEFNPADTTALLHLAQIQYDKGEFLRARAFVQRMEGAGGVSPNALELGARIEDRLGDGKAAARYRDRLANEYPGFVPQNPSGETRSP